MAGLTYMLFSINPIALGIPRGLLCVKQGRKRTRYECAATQYCLSRCLSKMKRDYGAISCTKERSLPSCRPLGGPTCPLGLRGLPWCVAGNAVDDACIGTRSPCIRVARMRHWKCQEARGLGKAKNTAPLQRPRLSQAVLQFRMVRDLSWQQLAQVGF